MNNMLADITGKAYLAKNNTQNAKAISHLKGIESIAQDAALIVRQLLSFAHASPLQKKNTLIVPLLKDAVKTAQLGIREDITFSADFSHESLIVYCDPVEIKQVVINLINNARDALPAEGVRKISLSVERKPRAGCLRRETCSACSAEVVHITVRGSGSGISESDLEHIFDPFFTTKAVGEGTGLGLSMARGGIEAHGGVIHVSSIVGKGSSFEICLPITNMPVTTSEAKQEDVTFGDGEIILVVDDEEVVRTTVSQVLQSLGYQVMLANDGAAGVELLRQHPERISLVISDIVMPVMDGVHASRAMRAIKADLPVIFITGYEGENLNTDTKHDALSSVIAKPFNIAPLSAEIHRLLHKT